MRFMHFMQGQSGLASLSAAFVMVGARNASALG
jgi:hypothetical protein